MTYYVVRLYSGSGDRPPERLLRDLVLNEALPMLRQSGGLRRYMTLIADDGRIGSTSVYDSKEAAQKGLRVARQWVQSTKAMQGYQLSVSTEGEIVRVIEGAARNEPVSFGAARVYQTAASAERVAGAISAVQPPGGRAGLVRTVVLSLDGGGVATFSGYISEEARHLHDVSIQQNRSSMGATKNVMPSDPEQFFVRVASVEGNL
jgi:hypothetical protein